MILDEVVPLQVERIFDKKGDMYIIVILINQSNVKYFMLLAELAQK